MAPTWRGARLAGDDDLDALRLEQAGEQGDLRRLASALAALEDDEDAVARAAAVPGSAEQCQQIACGAGTPARSLSARKDSTPTAAASSPPSSSVTETPLTSRSRSKPPTCTRYSWLPMTPASAGAIVTDSSRLIRIRALTRPKVRPRSSSATSLPSRVRPRT